MRNTKIPYTPAEHIIPKISTGKSGAQMLNAALELAQSSDKKQAGHQKQNYIVAAAQIRKLADQAKSRIY